MKKIIAKDLLDIKAVFLRPNEPIRKCLSKCLFL